MIRWLVTITVMLPTLIVIVDTAVVNVSLDHIRGSLSAGIDESTWTITSYLAANAIIIPMAGWLSRFFGRKRYLIFSISLFTFSSLMCGFSWNIQSLVFFRILQGLGGGSLQPISQAILLETFPPHQHGMAMAIYGIGIMFGPIIGPLLGGWITDNWSWHWIFYVNVPIGIVSILMALFFIVDPPYMERTKMKIDYWGLSLSGDRPRMPSDRPGQRAEGGLVFIELHYLDELCLHIFADPANHRRVLCREPHHQFADL